MRLAYIKYLALKKNWPVLFIYTALRGKINYIILKNSLSEFYIKNMNLNFILNFFKMNSNLRYNSLIDIFVADFPEKLYRFKLVYSLLSITNSHRVQVSTFVKEGSFLNSVKNIFPAADWQEREAWDMYGLFFINHGDLRRILTDYGFKGFPLKKDFPLTGYIQLRHDDTKGDIVYEPVKLAQELRFFNFSTGWERDQ